MVSNMCQHFGRRLGSMADLQDYYEFPTIERLAQKDVEDKLRKLSFGYRAKYIHQAAQYILNNHPEKPEEWLHSLRSEPYESVHKELVKVPGIGNKVADCIALMSLDKLEAIPIDTHVLSIADNIYKFTVGQGTTVQVKKKSANLTDKNYRMIGEFILGFYFLLNNTALYS